MQISKNNSPFRYPGGKASLTAFIAEIAELNDLQGGKYMELYAGGAGAAINLLFGGVFSHIHINDLDTRVFAAWYAILEETEAFCELIMNTPVSIEEWHKQKDIFKKGIADDYLKLGFATFFLNRTNRSGIIFNAGPIGGFSQKGNYKIDVRFNKAKLIERIRKIAGFKDHITLTNKDALSVLKNINSFAASSEKVFIYLDPPYYKKGAHLYMNNYSHLDHKALSEELAIFDKKYSWMVSYDNVSQIRNLYLEYRKSTFNLKYSLQEKKEGSELVVFSPNINLPATIIVNKQSQDLNLIA
ncbi:MAG: DNA adenine methylase [Candidatus Cyclonatronum sp.]|uniref:DNA adenine methylase n=1 Tax=Cyclonatronum sp. TaxID=3024185 RepID=UPI0025BD4424|nr:DNA adenine methylase [Cyclonatronum sp.]MCH8486369.1 DNA adenine methylase [Cyclonatronum sp.]